MWNAVIADMILPRWRVALLPLLAACAVLASPGRGQEPGAVLPEKHQALLKEHCLSCHGAEKQNEEGKGSKLTNDTARGAWRKRG